MRFFATYFWVVTKYHQKSRELFLDWSILLIDSEKTHPVVDNNHSWEKEVESSLWKHVPFDVTFVEYGYHHPPAKKIATVHFVHLNGRIVLINYCQLHLILQVAQRKDSRCFGLLAFCRKRHFDTPQTPKKYPRLVFSFPSNAGVFVLVFLCRLWDGIFNRTDSPLEQGGKRETDRSKPCKFQHM